MAAWLSSARPLFFRIGIATPVLDQDTNATLPHAFLVVSLDMANTKPFVQVAALCEKILEEQDGVISAIRLVDTFNVSAPPPGLSPDAPPVVEVNGLIALKSGDLVGKFTVGLVMENTIGERKSLSPEGGWPVVFNGGEHGIQLKLSFNVGVKNFGLCWFDVLFENEVLTRIPLRIRATEQQAPS